MPTPSSPSRAVRPSTKAVPQKSKKPQSTARTKPRKAASAADQNTSNTNETATASSHALPAKEKKVKVVRDSFTIPKSEFAQIAEMKKRALALGIEVKKSELIRAGLLVLQGMPDATFKKSLAGVPTLKTGRPAKN